MEHGVHGTSAAARRRRGHGPGVTGNAAFARAVWEGYRNGRRAAWLHDEDYEAVMAEPLAAAREHLRIAEPIRYREAQLRLAAAGLKGI